MKGIHGDRLTREIRLRQVALAMCVGLNDEQIASILDLRADFVARYRRKLLDSTGMQDSFEFALQQNAAVREKLWGESGELPLIVMDSISHGRPAVRLRGAAA